jgi:hypothetical protein
MYYYNSQLYVYTFLSRKCGNKLNLDKCIGFNKILLFSADGVLGAQVREFWYFWGSDIISSAVFPAAKIIYDSVLSQHHDYSLPGKIFCNTVLADVWACFRLRVSVKLNWSEFWGNFLSIM